ncbi:hypothetical protein T492DRAFT_881087 [Pavlovales sp. CCMP2436]|nr:hypothetical protein T492DRAFT_881087 [Pavlovales sp. CCMP2436]
MLSKRKGKNTTDASVPLLKPTAVAGGKHSGGSAKPTKSTWKEWEEEDARKDKVETKTSAKKKRSRSAFFGLVRSALAVLLLVVTFSLQPFALR